MSGEGQQRESADERLGAQVRVRRGELGISQTELARLMTERGWPWHQSTVYRVESGKQPVSFAQAVDLAAVMRTTTDRFTWGSAEANETDFTYSAGAEVRYRYEEVADAISHHIAAIAAADRLLERPPATDSQRVRDAREDVAERLKEYSTQKAIDEGVRRYEERHSGKEGDDGDGRDEEGQPGVVDQ